MLKCLERNIKLYRTTGIIVDFYRSHQRYSGEFLRISELYIFIFSNHRITRLHSKELQIARYQSPAVPNLNVRIIFRRHPERNTYIGRILPRGREAREKSIKIEKKAHLYNRKTYPIPDFQIIRCCSMPCGAFWKWIDPFESNLINMRLCALSYTEWLIQRK